MQKFQIKGDLTQMRKLGDIMAITNRSDRFNLQHFFIKSMISRGRNTQQNLQ